jgi:mannitol/fructose-specific phosphotransferase system IIA component (Ntr-type)
MNLKLVLDPKTITLSLAGSTKQAIIEELLDLLVGAGKLTNRQDALAAILDREAKMSTAIQNGVAIPHAKTDSVKELVTSIGIKPQGANFESMDGKPSTIFIMTLSPKSKLGPHIQFLSSISQSLEDASIRRSLLKAKTPDEVINLLTA